MITVGNTVPVITISAPLEGGFFDWGQKIAYVVSVSDAEDGAVDCSRVEVTFVLLHDWPSSVGPAMRAASTQATGWLSTARST